MQKKTQIILGALLVGVVLVFAGSLLLLQHKKVALPTPEATTKEHVPLKKVIGTSVEGRALEAYIYGNGETHVLFVGGIHGGYEWNSTILARTFTAYLNEHPEFIDPRLTIAVIPAANPDGIFAVTGVEGDFTSADIPTNIEETFAGRFNAHEVDLNRNFNCKWKPESTWRAKKVSAGTAAFSEPESAALRDFVFTYQPVAVVFWHSQANAVYASECEHGVLPETRDIMHIYADASGYTPITSFDAYETSGDAEGWLASIGIPAITVELKTHELIEWERNFAGIKALLNYYTNMASQ